MIIPIIVSNMDTVIASVLSESVAIELIRSSIQAYKIKYTGQ